MGSPSTLKETFQSQTLLALDSSSPLESMRAIEGEDGILDVAVFGKGLHVRVKDPDMALARIRRNLKDRGIAVHRLERIQPSMEDIFVAMIEEEEERVS